MSIFRTMALAAAATTMTALPVASHAAAPITQAPVARAAAPTADASDFAGIPPGPTATFISIGILAALVVIVLVFTDGGDGNNGNAPASP